MPVARKRHAPGALVAHPGGEAQTVVWVQMIQTGHVGGVPVTGWVKKELDALGVKEPSVDMDWVPLTEAETVLEDTRFLGRYTVRVGKVEADKPVAIIFSGGTVGLEIPEKDTAPVTLPRVQDSTKLVKYTMRSTVGSREVYLAFKVAATGGEGGGKK
jgi:hypothetical protein